MSILVTGAAGFVGLNVIEHLLRSGRAVIGFDTLPLPPRAARTFAALPGRLSMVAGTVLSAADLDRAFVVGGVEAVIHAAVVTAGVERERRDPERIVAVNVQGAVATLAAAGRHGAPRFVYPSSGAVYGTAAKDIAVIHEGLTPQPVMIYGMTKLACEILLPRIAEVQGTRLVVARLASVFGPWEYATGVRDTLSPMLGALLLARAGQEAVLSRPGLGDFCYARDIAAGLVALADTKAPGQLAYNLGSGVAQSAADWCAALAGVVPGFSWRLAGPGEAPNTVSHVAFDRGAFDIGAIRRDTGFMPRFSFAAAAADYAAWDAGGD